MGTMTSSRRRVVRSSNDDDDLHVDDMVEEILSRLPVKDVLRCKLLSKPYYALINNPSFIKRHLLHRSNSTNKIIAGENIYSNRSKIVSLDLPSLSSSHVSVPPLAMFPNGMDGNMIVAGSCKGLLFAVILSSANAITLLLWNPATMEHMIVPPPPTSFTATGFGYDAKSDDYKIAMISTASTIEIWSMKTNSWRQLQTGSMLLNIFIHLKRFSGVFVKEKLYWLGCVEDKNGRKMVLVSLGIGINGSCLLVTLPHEVARVSLIPRLNILDVLGSLALSVRLPINWNSDRCFYEIWVMDEENKNSWAKKYSIGPFSQQVELARISVNGMFLMSCQPLSCSKFFWYDPRTKDQTEPTSDLSLEEYSLFPPRSYTESLVSPALIANRE